VKKNLITDKRGILGLETVRVVIVTLLILAVTSIAVFLALVSLQDSNLFVADTGSGTFTNETINLTLAGNAPATVDPLTGVVLSSVVVQNATDGTNVISGGNWTTSGNLLLAVAASPFINTNVNVSASFTNTFDSQTTNDTNKIIGNITSGTTDFFANVPTFMVLLGVVVLLLIIAIVLVVVGRFGGTTGGADL
jgi:hypothetical protein